MSTELRIKLAHIGMEPAIIRKHEKRIKARIAHIKAKGGNDTQTSYSELHKLQHHRRWDVRNAARATHLACGFIKGIPYSAMESKTDVGKRRLYIAPAVVKMVRKYHDPEFTKEQLDDWFQA